MYSADPNATVRYGSRTTVDGDGCCRAGDARRGLVFVLDCSWSASRDRPQARTDQLNILNIFWSRAGMRRERRCSLPEGSQALSAGGTRATTRRRTRTARAHRQRGARRPVAPRVGIKRRRVASRCPWYGGGSTGAISPAAGRSPSGARFPRIAVRGVRAHSARIHHHAAHTLDTLSLSSGLARLAAASPLPDSCAYQPFHACLLLLRWCTSLLQKPSRACCCSTTPPSPVAPIPTRALGSTSRTH